MTSFFIRAAPFDWSMFEAKLFNKRYFFDHYSLSLVKENFLTLVITITPLQLDFREIK
jgi:hypothetical protein